EGVLKEMGEIALALFCQLQPPGMEDGVDREEQSRRALKRIKEIFGLHTDHPPIPKVALGAGQLQGCQQDAGGTIAGVTPTSSRPQGSHQDAGVAKEGVMPASSRQQGSQQPVVPTAEEQRQRYP